MAARHTCDWIDANNNYFGVAVTGVANNPQNGGATANLYTPLWNKVQAPANAAKAQLFIVATANGGVSAPAAYATRFYLGQTQANQTEPSPWAPAGVTQIEGGDITANSVTAGQIAAGAIGAGQIAAGAVTATQLAAGSVTANALAANAVTAGSILAGAITGDKLAANNIISSSAQIGNLVVGTINIMNGAVTLPVFVQDSGLATIPGSWQTFLSMTVQVPQACTFMLQFCGEILTTSGRRCVDCQFLMNGAALLAAGLLWTTSSATDTSTAQYTGWLNPGTYTFSLQLQDTYDAGSQIYTRVFAFFGFFK